MNFKNISLGLATATIMAVGVVTTATSAQAITLNGTIEFSGASASIPDLNTVGSDGNLTFGNVTTITKATGDFGTVTPSFTASGITVNSLPLKLTDQISGNTTTKVFSGSAVNPFINFGARTINGITNQLAFVLNSNTYTGTMNDGIFRLETASGPLLGNFLFGTETVAGGTLTAFEVAVGDTSTGSGYTIHLTTVPTPALLPGLLGIGIAAIRKRKAAENTVETAEANT